MNNPPSTLHQQVRLNRTLKSLQEYYHMDDQDKSTDSILYEEPDLPKQGPNYSKIYGLSYKLVQHIIEQYDLKATQKTSKISLNQVQRPFPLLILDSDYLRQACEHLKVESRRLLRVYYVCCSRILKKVFALCFW